MRELLTLSFRVFNDTIPKNTDAHFLYSQTLDNEKSVVKAALNTQFKKLTEKWLIMKTAPISGYEGFETFQKSLQKAGIEGGDIQGIPSNKDILHTLIESLAAVDFCKNMGYTSLIVSAAPFQQLRAFMTAVTAAERLYPSLKIYSLAGAPFPWHEQVVHSQGKTVGTRASLIEGEIDRIGIYGKKGDLLKVPAVLDYLNRRDSRL